MDDLGWLRLQLEWGADEALDERPSDRRHVPAPPQQSARPASPPSSPPSNPPSHPPSPPPPPPPPAASVPTGLGALSRAQALAAGAPTTAALREALAGFDGCALRATATNLVFSDGDPASRLVLVTDVPGAAEDRAGVPFAGPAAAFLDRMLAAAGLDRADFLATSLLPWRPPGDRKPAEAEVQLCLPFALRHLELLAPSHVLLFGGLATRTLLSGDGRRPRTGWLDLHIPGLPAPVPALAFPSVMHIQATPAAKREAWANLLRLRRALTAHNIHV